MKRFSFEFVIKKKQKERKERSKLSRLRHIAHASSGFFHSIIICKKEKSSAAVDMYIYKLTNAWNSCHLQPEIDNN